MQVIGVFNLIFQITLDAPKLMDLLTCNVATEFLPTTVLNLTKCVHLAVGPRKLNLYSDWLRV